MNRLIRYVVMTAVVIGWTGLLHAADAPASAAPAKKEPPKHSTMECEFVSLSADGKSIEVKADGKTEKLVLSDKRKVKIDGKEASLKDLKPGTKCECTVFDKKDGTKSVSRIVVGEDKPSKKEMKKEGKD